MDIRVQDFADKHLEVMLRGWQVRGITAAEKMVLTSLSLIKDRLNKEGVAGATYSKGRVAIAFFEGKALNAGGQEYIREQIESHQGGNWREFRVANRRQVAIVDMNFSGLMLAGFTMIHSFANDFHFTAQSGGVDPEVIKKLEGNMAHYGNEVFDPLPDEIEEAEEIMDDFFTDLISDYLDD